MPVYGGNIQPQGALLAIKYKVPAEGFFLLPVVVLFDYSIGFKNVIRFVIGEGAQHFVTYCNVR